MAWRANGFVIVANGGTPALDTSGALPVGPVRLMVGAAPYSATGGSDRPRTSSKRIHRIPS